MSFEVVASFPSFQILSPKTSGLSTAFPAGVRLIHINVPSDGNPDHLPTDKAQKKADPPTLYLEKCGHIWGKTYRLDNAYTYYLQALPHGYTFWQKSRPGNPRQVDGWLYGHPRRKRFTSPNEFFTHLHYLTENNGISIGCPCRQCVGPTGVLGPLRAGTGSISTSSESTPSVQQVTISAAATPVLESAASSPAPNLKRKPGRPPKNAESALAPTSGTTASHSQFKDEEGTPDVVQGLFHKLERDGQCDQDIDEKLSPDFEALRLPLKDWQEQTAAQPAWAPRAGEIVLFVRDINAKCTISYENSTAAFKLYDYTKKRFLGPPTWEAGVVSQETVRPFELSIEDIINEKDKKQSVTYYGYRVEPMPPPNQPNKSLSLRYVYVPMQHIRPLAFWKEVLNGVQNPHESLVNAQTVMATAALVGRRRFKGNWPNASIFCSGIYIGSEFIQEEDLIRLAASTGCVTDIMEVRQIKLSFNNLQASSSSPEAENSGIFFAGKAFTVDPAKAFSDSGGPCRADVYPDYGSLYWLHDPNRLYKVSLAKVLGRCFEPDAMRLWFPTLPANNPSAVLTQGMRGIIDARNFSTKTDKRLQPGQAWFWADTRMQALDLHSLNGVEASSHDRLREDKLEAGQKALRVLARPTAKNQADMRQAAERPKAHAGDALGMGKQISQQASNNRQAGATDDENGDRDGSCGDDEIHRSVEEEKDSDDEVEITKTVTAPVKRKKRSAEAMSATQTPGVGSGRSNSNGSNKREDEDEDPVKMLQRFKAQRIST